jgi:formamidopyrimidine-DNA glycosylase
MPELPDIAVYIECLEPRIVGRVLQSVRVANPFLLRTVDPPLASVAGRRVVGLRRIGKRIAIGFEGEVFIVLHLMIAGRLHWRDPGARLGAKRDLAGFWFPDGTLVLTEAGSKRRASLHVVAGEAGLRAMDPGGLEVLDCDEAAFTKALTSENHTLKRALTDPRLFSGIGNAYSDEILHRARLSPVAMTRALNAAQISDLYSATRCTLSEWIVRLRDEAGGGFPEKVTAFRPGMAVHGRYREACPTCGAPIQRIVHADNETNYCARCQTEGKILADRALSRLLKGDWPRSLEELEKSGRQTSTPPKMG